VIVNTASPKAIALAALELINDPILLQKIGKSGYHSIKPFFTVQRQMEEYSNFYKALRQD
jgi:glycosyltransferase involved in cell wall biosynthesis